MKNITASALARRAIVIVSALTALAATSHVHAIDRSELKIAGVVRPVACTPFINSGGAIDFGTIWSSNLKPGEYTSLPAKEVTFRFSCEAATKIAIRPIDNRATTKVTGMGKAPEASVFGLGAVNGNNIGGFTFNLKPGSLEGDSAVIDTISAPGNLAQATWDKQANGSFQNGRTLSFAAAGAVSPSPFKVIAGTLSVTPTFNKPENLPLNQDLPLDGSVTLDVIYP